MLIDSHCHLHFANFKDDIELVLARAKQADIKAMLCVATSLEEFASVVKATTLGDNVYASTGVHPCNVDSTKIVQANQIAALCAHPKVIAIGETGLDYYHPNFDQSAQIKSLIEHIKASQITGLPLIIHTRNAGRETLDVLKQQLNIKHYSAVIHCFTESADFAAEALDMGFYLSFSGIVTFKNATDLQDIAKSVPLEKILVETDAPYLAPNPYRGKRNEPSYTRETARFIADLRGVKYDDFCKITTNNFYNLFTKAEG